MPATQLLQVDAPVDAVMVPGAQTKWAMAPVGQADPAGHVVHELDDVPPVAVR